MKFPALFQRLMRGLGRNPNRTTSPKRRAFLPRLDVLEDRTVPTTITVMNNHDSGTGSLRQAILDANATAAQDTIVFHSDVHSITLTSGELVVNSHLIILGPGANRLTISGNDASRVFDVRSNNVGIFSLTVTDGLADGNAPNNPSVGGGILNQGNLWLANVVLDENQAIGDPAFTVSVDPVFNSVGGAFGGGVANFGALDVIGCTFTGNQVRGADYADSSATSFPGPAFPGNAMGAALSNYNTATITNSLFASNTSQAGSNCRGDFAGIAGGGAIVNDAVMTITGSTFSANQALAGDNNVSPFHNGHALGGAIMDGSLKPIAGLPGATLTINQSRFDHNRAVGGDDNQVTLPIAQVPAADAPDNAYGGALLVLQGSITVNATAVDYNQAVAGAGGAAENGSLGVGGGIFLLNFLGGVTGSISDCTISHNEATGGDGRTGGDGGAGLGGGLAAGGLGAPFRAPGTATVRNTTVDHNLAVGGNGGQGGNGGNGLGGGLYNGADSALIEPARMITQNEARGGKKGQGGSDGQGIGDEAYTSFKVNGGGTAPNGIPLFPGGTAPHNATGTATLLGNYTGEGTFQLLTFNPATLSGTFTGSFVFVAANGDRLAFKYGAVTPGTVTATPTADGKLIGRFVAQFTPDPTQSTGAFADVTGGSFIMIATTQPFSPSSSTPGYTAPFQYSWEGEGWLQFG